jgi:hypothetical protein
MEYLLEHVEQAALLSGDRAAVVNVPSAARYAVHKLVVHGEREGAFVAKSAKNLTQAACLVAYFKDRRRWEIEEALADLTSRGKGWALRAHRGLTALDRAFPELAAASWLAPTGMTSSTSAHRRGRARERK